METYALAVFSQNCRLVSDPTGQARLQVRADLFRKLCRLITYYRQCPMTRSQTMDLLHATTCTYSMLNSRLPGPRVKSQAGHALIR